MLLAIAIILGFVSVALAPLGDGLFDTSMWAAKVMLPPETSESENATAVLKVTQASLMDGWLSNIPFALAGTFFGSMIAAGFVHWWLAPAFFVAIIPLRVLAKRLWTRPACHYLLYIYNKMINRAADYLQKRDMVRFEAAEETRTDLEALIAMYDGTRLKPPGEKDLKDVPFGDMAYWRDRWAGK